MLGTEGVSRYCFLALGPRCLYKGFSSRLERSENDFLSLSFLPRPLPLFFLARKGSYSYSRACLSPPSSLSELSRTNYGIRMEALKSAIGRIGLSVQRRRLGRAQRPLATTSSLLPRHDQSLSPSGAPSTWSRSRVPTPASTRRAKAKWPQHTQ